MDVQIIPARLEGDLAAIPSKSHLHRLLIAVSLAGAEIPPEADGISEDIAATAEGLRAILTCQTPSVFCGESGSTLRFLLPLAAALRDRSVFFGRGRLPLRPMEPLKAALSGVSAGPGAPPSGPGGCRFSFGGRKEELFTVSGRLRPGDYFLPGNVSSQYITGLLTALPLLSGTSRIFVSRPAESFGYLEMTLRVLERFGINVILSEERDRLIFSVKGGQSYRLPCRDAGFSLLEETEGDWSNSAFWLVAGAVSGLFPAGASKTAPNAASGPENPDSSPGGNGTARLRSGIRLIGLSPDSAQQDKEIVPLLRKLGARVWWDPPFLSAAPGSFPGPAAEKEGGGGPASEIDVSHIPDLVPALAAAASVSSGVTRITNAGRVRIKESDRLHAMAENLNRLGGNVREEAEGLIIRGVPFLSGGTVSSFNDHRIVMALASVSPACAGPLIIRGAEAVNKSYPSFFDHFRFLGGRTEPLQEKGAVL